MAITYAWTFPALDVAPSADGFSNVVKTVHWRYSAREGDYSAETYGTVALPDPEQPFTNYESLTPEIVIGWVVGVLGADAVAEMETSLAAQIAHQKSPPVVALPPPWE